MPDPKGITPFKKFVDTVSSAKHVDFAAMGTVARADAFDAMKAHILKLYEAVEARHSFADENGSIFDCIPIEQQPSLRGKNEKPGKPTDLPDMPAARRTKRATKRRRSSAGRKDHGNVMNCPAGTILICRVTLQDYAVSP
jgi:hypothetical protein